MWQLSIYRIGWIPSLLGLTLLAACSQTAVQEQTTGDSSGKRLRDRTPVVAVGNSPTPSLPTTTTTGQATTPTVEQALSSTPTFLTTERMAGFSSDGNYYLYLESSRDTGAGIPKSTLQVIDLSSNTCVENGCVETRYGESDANLNLAEVEQDLLQRTWKLRQELSLTPPTNGTVLPILSRSRTPDGSETVTVRLPNSDQPLQLGLRQQRVAGGTTGKERAAMQLEVIHNGQRRSLDSLDNYRDWVLEYSIREVRQAPSSNRIAILITATKPTFEGTLATTLVQGVELRDGGETKTEGSRWTLQVQSEG